MRKIFIITGPIGSGKSSACRFLRKYDFQYINSDQLAKHIIKNDKNIKKKISKLLKLNYELSERIPWKRIRNFISMNTNNKKNYNAIIHTIFYNKLNRLISKSKDNFVIEIPLLETIKEIKYRNKIICILANEKNRKKRFMKNKGKNELQFDCLNKLQKSKRFYIMNSDYVIHNDNGIRTMTDKLISIIKSN
tara:strand:- start:386 stop:961 length:576 start_codon:yes stop_codon:yes gene_type:complete